jgi:hypothetical protein
MGHQLSDAGVVAEVDEDEATMVALGRDPAGEANRGADVAFAELAGADAAVAVDSERATFGHDGSRLQGEARALRW